MSSSLPFPIWSSISGKSHFEASIALSISHSNARKSGSQRSAYYADTMAVVSLVVFQNYTCVKIKGNVSVQRELMEQVILPK